MLLYSVYLVSLALAFISAFLLIFAASVNLKVLQEKVSLREQELAKSLWNRAVLPFIANLVQIANRLTPAGLNQKLKHRLVLAGNPKGFDVDKLMTAKVLSGLGGLVLAIFVFALRRSIPAFYGGALLTAACFFIPDFWLNYRIKIRQKDISLLLPDTLDLLTISVEAGLGFDAALSKVIRNTTGPLAEEFFRMLQEITLGSSRRDAFKRLSERTTVPELQGFILAMLQADIFGISVARVLRIQAREMRIKRRQKAEETAMKAPVKMVFPLILCIFPALLVIVLGPAVVKIYTAFMQSL